MKTIDRTFALLLTACSTMLSPALAPAQDTPPAVTEPLAVDVHPSPYRAVVHFRMNLGHQRFDMRDATILDLIAFAYNREPDAILAGPTWIDFDRFDVLAFVPSLKPPAPNSVPADGTGPRPDPYEPARPLIQRALEQRFHLKYHTEQRPLPGYIMTVSKEGAKLAAAKDPTAPPNCHAAQEKATPSVTLTCTSQTITQLLATFGGIFPHPVVDRTGLTGTYDLTMRLDFTDQRTSEEAIHAWTDAFSKQLGLVVSSADVPQPAIVVESVERPTPTPPGVAKLIPALPNLEFEVATIRPSAENEPHDQIRPGGSQITFVGYSMQSLLVRAWQLKTGAMLGNAPAWLAPTRYTILVKLPPDIDARSVFADEDQFDNMLQRLLIDRFQIKFHWGEQTQDGYVLLPGAPKMKKADPNSRTFCKYGPPAGEKDVRSAPDSPFDNESHCQNVSMDQFADAAQALAGSEIKNRVANKTGLAGSYDITLYYTSARKLRADASAADAAAKQAGDAAAAVPTGGLSVQDAFRKELGLRLERQPGTYPALILDHIEQTPTDN